MYIMGANVGSFMDNKSTQIALCQSSGSGAGFSIFKHANNQLSERQKYAVIFGRLIALFVSYSDFSFDFSDKVLSLVAPARWPSVVGLTAVSGWKSDP